MLTFPTPWIPKVEDKAGDQQGSSEPGMCLRQDRELRKL